jgi:hypothetical protein
MTQDLTGAGLTEPLAQSIPRPFEANDHEVRIGGLERVAYADADTIVALKAEVRRINRVLRVHAVSVLTLAAYLTWKALS